MSQIIPFLNSDFVNLLKIVLGIGIMLSSIYRLWRLDVKVNKLGYAFLHLTTMLGAWEFVAGDPWGPLLILASVAIQHALTAKGWSEKAPDITLKECK
jgi:hypothetical protein